MHDIDSLFFLIFQLLPFSFALLVFPEPLAWNDYTFVKQTTISDLKIQFSSQQELRSTGFALVGKHCDAASMGTWSGENFSFRTCLTNESSHRNGQASQTLIFELIHGGNFSLSGLRQISDKSVPSQGWEGGSFIPNLFPDGANITYYFLLNILASLGCSVTATSTFD